MKYLISFFICFITFHTAFTQTPDHEYFLKKGEVYFRFPNTGTEEINKLTTIISIDNVTKDSVYAYANEEEFNKFLSMKIPFKVLPKPGDVAEVRMSSNLKDIKDWDYYPTYDAYVAMMNQFQSQYPSLCRIVEIGTTVQGRKLLFAKITDNPDINEVEPEFMYSSSMHGDELTGYILMLRLIDYLLSNYGTNQEVTQLVNNIEIWINPLANPDGTYRSGNSTVQGATRSNYNNVDLNRNYPDPAAGQHPDGKAWQPETIAMMNFFQNHNFRLSANFHGGAEVVNYPWDTWAKLHPDNTWWRQLCRAYADTVHLYSPATYMDDLENGITNGYAWYRVTGGRQDYMTYFMRGREITIELSNAKLPVASSLPTYWNYNFRSLMNFMKYAQYGITGTVKDIFGKPLKAKIFIQSYDADNSDIYTDSLTGDYYRLLAPGLYTVIVSADSFITQIFTNVQVSAWTSTNLNVVLKKTNQLQFTLNTANGWNLLSVPLNAPAMHKDSLFPNALSPAYIYNNGYMAVDTLKPGKAFWIKFSQENSFLLNGNLITASSIPVTEGWNLIGVFDKNIPVAQISSTPANIITSQFYSYNGGYNIAETLEPGKGYWVKVNQNGIINFPMVR